MFGTARELSERWYRRWMLRVLGVAGLLHKAQSCSQYVSMLLYEPPRAIGSDAVSMERMESTERMSMYSESEHE